jgi:hypothetical protein
VLARQPTTVYLSNQPQVRSFGVSPTPTPQLLLLLLQVSCMPGGTASNIVAYIARGDMVSPAHTFTACDLLHTHARMIPKQQLHMPPLSRGGCC